MTRRNDDVTEVIRREQELTVGTEAREELVIEKRLVVRERVIVRKHTVPEERLIEADLRREGVEVEADSEIADRVTHEEATSWGSDTGNRAGAPATTIQGGSA